MQDQIREGDLLQRRSEGLDQIVGQLRDEADGVADRRVPPAREIDPTMPIIYMTGTHGEEWASKGVPNSLLLAKPFAPAQIVTAISQLLNATPPVPPAE